LSVTTGYMKIWDMYQMKRNMITDIHVLNVFTHLIQGNSAV